jgi:broad specificity phosphatase PhoE
MGILYLARHGVTEHNLKEIYMGQRDIELNETGIKQAHELGKKMKNIDVDFIIVSPLKRAKQTAEIVNQYINKKIILDNRLKERCAGLYEGLTKKEVEEKFQA